MAPAAIWRRETQPQADWALLHQPDMGVERQVVQQAGCRRQQNARRCFIQPHRLQTLAAPEQAVVTRMASVSA